MEKAFREGQHVGGFVVAEEIHEGQFSETWKCVNPISGRSAVLKGLKKEIVDGSDPVLAQLDLNARAREEAQILTALFD